MIAESRLTAADDSNAALSRQLAVDVGEGGTLGAAVATSRNSRPALHEGPVGTRPAVIRGETNAAHERASRPRNNSTSDSRSCRNLSARRASLLGFGEHYRRGTTFDRPYGDVFDDLDNDQADFAIVAKLGGRGAEIQGSSVHMYVWDRGAGREVHLLVSKHLLALGVKANRKIDRFLHDLQHADSSTVVRAR